MTTAQPQGEIRITFEQDGNVKFDVEGKVNYLALYGSAATLHEMARMQQAQDAMKSMMGPQGIVRAGGIPGIPLKE